MLQCESQKNGLMADDSFLLFKLSMSGSEHHLVGKTVCEPYVNHSELFGRRMGYKCNT